MEISLSPWEMITLMGSGSDSPRRFMFSMVARIEFFMSSKIM